MRRMACAPTFGSKNMKRNRSEAEASNTPVGLNVGGQVFWTTRTTLTSTTGHVLHRIIDDSKAGGMQGTALRDEQGLAFIDRDPRWFQSVLNFLRDRHVPLPPCWHERQQLRQEALFYGLDDLVALVEAADVDGKQLRAAETWDAEYQLPCKEARDSKHSSATIERLELVGVAAKEIVAVLDELPETDATRLVGALGRIARRVAALREPLKEVHGLDGMGDEDDGSEEEDY